MAGFGGAVKLTGESEYRKALSQITQSLKVVSAEMKATSSAYDAGDKSSKELAQASKELKQSLEIEKTALAGLKSQLNDMQAEYTQTQLKHVALLKEYDKEVTELERIEKELGTSSQEYKEQEKAVNDLSKELAKSEKEYDAQGKAIDQMRIQTANAETQCNNTSKAIENMGQSAEKSADGFTVMRGVLANLATDVIRSAIDGMKQLGDAFINVGKQALSSYAEFEQLEGGVKKIFGDEMAQTVMSNAQNAFKTAGMSANEYMETVTGFSASLIQSLDGDTAQATEVADRAIRDMADNANTFGTSMQSIQNAYQGFAKGNYTMLDNLKLGYGGTKEEMSRLIEDASQMTDVMEELGITVDANDMSFANIANAISVVQANMGIMNTTIKEADGTIKGATGSMQGAWQNMLTGIADENADFSALASDFIGTLITPDGKGGVIGTLVPRISTVIQGMSEAIQTLLPQLISTIVPVIEQNLPQIMQAVSGALRTLVSLLPEIVSALSGLIPMIISELTSMLPTLAVSAIQIVLALADGIREAIPQLMATLPEILSDLVEIIIEWLPDIIDAGIQLTMALLDGLMQALPAIIEDLPRMITQIVDGLLSQLPTLIDAGITLFMALVDNLPAIIQGIVDAIPLIIDGIVNALVANLPAIVDAGVRLFMAIVQNLPQILVEIGKAIPTIIGELVTGILNSIPVLASAVGELIGVPWDEITNFFTSTVPEAFENAKSMVSEFLNGIVEFFESIPEKINQFIQSAITFIEDLPYNIGRIFGLVIGNMIVFERQAWEWVQTKISAIIDGIENFFKTLPDRVMTWLTKTISNIGQWSIDMVNKAIETGENFIKNVIEFIKTLPEKVWEWLTKTIENVSLFVLDLVDTAKKGAQDTVDKFLETISELPTKMFDVGKNIVEGMWNGITSMGNWLKDKIKEFAKGVLDGMKEALGIASPSKVFRDEVGKYIAQGIGVGFMEEMENVSKEMQGAIPTSFDFGNGSSVATSSRTEFMMTEMVDAFKEALSQVKIEMDDEQMGQFVDKTVSNLVYA